MVWGHHSLLMHSTTEGNLAYFQLLVAMNRAAMTTCIGQVIFKKLLFIFLLKRFLFEYHCVLWRFKNVPVNSLTFFPLKVVSMPLSPKSAWAAINSSTSQRWCYVTLGLGWKRHAVSAMFTRTPALGSLTPSEKSAPLSHRAGEGRAGLAGSRS